VKCLVLYSHASGHRNFARKLAYTREHLLKSFEAVDFVCSLSKEDAFRLAQGKGPLYDALIVVGGDGSFNNVVNALAPLGKTPILGYLNFGTLGDIGRNFGVGRSLKQGLAIIERGHIEPFDVGMINGAYFAYSCTIGRYSDIAYMTPRKKKKVLGRVAYYNEAVKELANKKTVHAKIQADGKIYEVDTPFLLLLNGKDIGGFKVNGGGSIQDGKMELYLAKPDFLNGVYHVLTGRKTLVISASSFQIETDEEMSWCLDGERGPQGLACVSCLTQRLRIFSKPLRHKSI
jgi:diacylglycerol kinase (ATP)